MKPQDSSNKHAAVLARVAEAFEVPYTEVSNAFEEMSSFEPEPPGLLQKLYNPVGNAVMTANYGVYAGYAVRVADLEGIRRAAVLASELRSRGATPSDAVVGFDAAELADPYTLKPFDWDPESNELVFHGLEASERGEHRFRL